MKVYTYKNIEFSYGGGLNIYVGSSFLPLPVKQCNGVLYWQLPGKVRMSINQFKEVRKQHSITSLCYSRR